MQYNRARYYSPTLQRVISEDPLGFGGGDVNLYAYAGNDPINASDPSGMSSLKQAVDTLYHRLIQPPVSLGGRKSATVSSASNNDKVVLVLDLAALGLSGLSAAYTDATVVAFCGFGPEGCVLGYGLAYAEVQPFLLASDLLGTASTIVGCTQNGWSSLTSAGCQDSVILSAVGWIINEPNVDAVLDFLAVERDLGVLK